MPRHTSDSVIVTCNCHLLEKYISIAVRYSPDNVLIGVQDGTFHSLTFPDQLPVARILLLGEKRTCAMGRSSPI